MNLYLPRCCIARATCVGDYEVCHAVDGLRCRHKTDGVRRVIGTGRTKTAAIVAARSRLDLAPPADPDWYRSL